MREPNTQQDVEQDAGQGDQDTTQEVMMVFRAHYEELKAFVLRCAFEHSLDCDDEELALWFEQDKGAAQSICDRNKWTYEIDPSALEWLDGEDGDDESEDKSEDEPEPDLSDNWMRAILDGESS